MMSVHITSHNTNCGTILSRMLNPNDTNRHQLLLISLLFLKFYQLQCFVAPSMKDFTRINQGDVHKPATGF